VSVENLLQQLGETIGCHLVPPSGLPQLPPGLTLPDEIRTFYSLCGGAELFLDQNFGFRIVAPSEFERANPVVLGNTYHLAHQAELDSDITNNWYLIARGAGPEEGISIDLSVNRQGHCYDSFHEVHGTPDSHIIALSFTELLDRLLSCGGKALFWEHPDFPDYGRVR
jgi:hypothetical protein